MTDERFVGIAERKAIHIVRYNGKDIRTQAYYPNASISSHLRLARVLDNKKVGITYHPYKACFTYVWDYDNQS